MIVIRAFFFVVWMLAFFMIAAVTLSFSATAGVEDATERERLSKASAEKYAGLTCLGSVGLAALLGVLGVLPGTRRRRQPKPTEPGDDAGGDLPASTGQRGLPDAAGVGRTPGPPDAVASAHEFTLTGFFERWGRIAVGAPFFLGLGIFFMAARLRGGGQGIIYLGMVFVAMALGIAGFLTWRLLAIWTVRLDDTGVTWSGAFGSSHQAWDAIVAVYRTEQITNRQWRKRELKLEFADGSSVKFDQAVTNFGDLAESIQATTGDLIMVAKHAELLERGTADFGPVTVKKDGVDMKGEFIPWEGLGRYSILNGHLVLFALPIRRKADAEAPLSEIPNYLVLLDMLAMKSGRG